MRKSSLTLLAAVIGLAAGQASAADIPRRAPAPAPAYVPQAPPIMTWTGCYIGGNVGGIFGRAEADFRNGELSSDNSGFAGGGQIGCDYQFPGGWVIGFRNMLDWASLSRERTIDFNTGDRATVKLKNDWFDTLTGRIGYAYAPNFLVYGQGGAVWAKNSAEVHINGDDLGTISKTRTGWTAGGGVEWMFAPNWSAFLEGNYMDFGSNDRNIVTPNATVCANGCAFSAKATATTVLFGVNYRWNWGGATY